MKQCSYCLTHTSFCVDHWWPNFGVKCLSITSTQTCAVEAMLVGSRISSLSPVFPLYNPPSQQSEMLINQLREITGIQDPQILYKALNVRPKKLSFIFRIPTAHWIGSLPSSALLGVVWQTYEPLPSPTFTVETCFQDIQFSKEHHWITKQRICIMSPTYSSLRL